MSYGPSAHPNCLPLPHMQRAPRISMPPLSVDAHLHVFPPVEQYPMDSRRSYTPHVSTLAQYRSLMQVLGIERAVLVQPSVYGTDNRAHLDALTEGGASFRGVMVPKPNVSEDELQSMHERGVRGIRLNVVNPSVLSVDDAIALSKRVAPLGWHLQLHLNLGRDGMAPLLDIAARTALPLVIDHMGRLTPNFIPPELLDLLRAGRCWVKLSGSYRISALPYPHADLQAVVQALVAANADQLVWGSDWPHPELHSSMPQAADLVDLLSDWIPDQSLRHHIAVDNPARLYDF